MFGFGLDCVRDQDEALRACRLLLKEEGWLILGWNFDRSAEPSELPTLRDYFQPSSFPSLAQRQMFDKSTHVYGTFRLHSAKKRPPAQDDYWPDGPMSGVSPKPRLSESLVRGFGSIAGDAISFAGSAGSRPLGYRCAQETCGNCPPSQSSSATVPGVSHAFD